jgi:hypothetical protein
MNELDSDNNQLNLNGKVSSRDIVQFVPFRDFLNRSDSHIASQDLAKALLAEVPTQLLAFMKSKGFTPKYEGSNLI